MSGTPPTGLLRSPATLEDSLTEPIQDQRRRENRYRKPEASAIIATAGDADPITLSPVLSEDTPALTMRRTRTTKAGRVTLTGLADGEPDATRAPPMTVYINGGEPRFAGRITSAYQTPSGVLMVTAFDATRQLNRATFSNSYREESVGKIASDICTSAQVAHAVADRFFALDQLQPEGEPIEAGYRRIVAETGRGARSGEQTTASGPTGDQPGEAERDYLTVTHDFNDANAAQALTDLAEWAGAEWYVSQRNRIIFVKNVNTNELTLNAVRQSKAGSEAPPVRKVVVKGGPKGGGRGESGAGNTSNGSGQGGGASTPDPGNPDAGQTRRTNRTAKTHYRGVAGDENAPRSQTTIITSRGANSERMAQNVAENVWRRIQRQVASGDIELVGDPNPRPLDKIRLPNYVDGADTGYIVTTVEHRITSDEGFVTTITPGGDPDRTFADESTEQTPSEEASGATGWGDGSTADPDQPYPDIPGGGAH